MPVATAFGSMAHAAQTALWASAGSGVDGLYVVVAEPGGQVESVVWLIPLLMTRAAFEPISMPCALADPPDPDGSGQFGANMRVTPSPMSTEPIPRLIVAFWPPPLESRK